MAISRVEPAPYRIGFVLYKICSGTNLVRRLYHRCAPLQTADRCGRDAARCSEGELASGSLTGAGYDKGAVAHFLLVRPVSVCRLLLSLLSSLLFSPLSPLASLTQSSFPLLSPIWCFLLIFGHCGIRAALNGLFNSRFSLKGDSAAKRLPTRRLVNSYCTVRVTRPGAAPLSVVVVVAWRIASRCHRHDLIVLLSSEQALRSARCRNTGRRFEQTTDLRAFLFSRR